MGFEWRPEGGDEEPDYRENLRRARERMQGLRWRLPGTWILLAVVLLWLASGIYAVGPAQQGVVRRFGRHVATTGPGLHYRLPWPVETVVRVSVTEVRRIELGFRTVSPGPMPQYRSLPDESLMLTGDENIVVTEVILQYRIKDAAAYLFNVKAPDATVRAATQAALRQVVGAHAIDDVLTVGKAQVQEEVRALVQEILDAYQAGIHVVAVQLQDVHPPDPVVSAFKDVASAREDQAKIINQAETYANDVIPRARGEAQRVLREAEGYKAARVARAEGDAQRFRLLAQEYRKSPDVTRTRLHLEMLEAVLPGTRKVIVGSSSAGEGLVQLLDVGNLALQPLTEVKGAGASRAAAGAVAGGQLPAGSGGAGQ